MTAIPTLNVSVDQIESDLRRGRTVDQIVADWSEPKPNVLAVLHRMRRENGNGSSKPPAAGAPVSAVGARPETSASPSARGVSPSDVGCTAPTVDALVSASARSTSTRTQRLGVKLHDLAGELQKRLTAEREEAERADRAREELAEARAEVERLEAALRDARAKLRPARQGGGIPCAA